MFQFILTIICFTLINGETAFGMTRSMAFSDVVLPSNESLQPQDVKTFSKAHIVESIHLYNCSGVINELTFQQFPKLWELVIWNSSIQEINTVLPLTRLVVANSHFPNLYRDLPQKLPKLQSTTFIGVKNFKVDPHALRYFKYLKEVAISEANYTENCVTKDWFKGLEDLLELSLSDSNISCISEDAFDEMKDLRSLDLTYNHIGRIDKKWFRNLLELEELGIFGNDFDTLNLDSLASQEIHLEELGVSWEVLKNSNISAEDLLEAFPKLKNVFFGHEGRPNDFEADVFCQLLKQRDVHCEKFSLLGVAKFLVT